MEGEINIGFRKEPKGLEDFLRKEAYLLVHGGRSHTVYVKDASGLPALFYYSPPPDPTGDRPHWNNSGFEVVAQLDITYNPSNTDEAQRLANTIMQIYSTVYFDGKEYFTNDNP